MADRRKKEVTDTPGPARQSESTEQVTRLLVELNNGNHAAIESLMPLVYDELRRIAARHLNRERPDHTLQPTALVHEAYMRLVDQRTPHWQNRLHFMSVAATMMRRVLIDHAKARHRVRRGGANQQRVLLEDNLAGTDNRVLEVLAIDEALDKLAALDAQQARVVELRFFGGLSVEETAQVMGVSTPTVKRYANSARAFLHREMRREGPEPGATAP
ncbi:MAG: sigma-70 family RNA polymerase sigma factor [Bryobacterales bacterium]|nr:sigma-70 family RNA polymerase sigma factor [Bryobacterales bacterium]